MLAVLLFVIWLQLVDKNNNESIKLLKSIKTITKWIFGGSMKRKPDSMVALVFLFCLGLAATGFASMLSDDEPRIGHNIVVQADIKD